MIKINVNKDNDLVKKISIKGHALYDDYGKDIVCASVSSIVICTVNLILRMNENYIECSYNDDEMIIVVNENNSQVDLALVNMIDLLNQLMKKYPKNIEIK